MVLMYITIMDFFKLVVLAIATIILVIVFTGIGILLSFNTSNVYPPTSNTCPDFWTVNTSGANCCNIPPYNSVSPNPNVGNIYDTSGNLLISADGSIGTATPGYNNDNNGNVYINFNDPGWAGTGLSAVCAQKAWTGLTNIVWDGISNYNSC